MTVTEVEASEVPWERCREPGCTGVRTAGGACLAHLEATERASALGALSRGRPLDARGVHVDAVLLGQILDATPCDDAGRPILNRARFNRATFAPGTGFAGVVFAKEASFDRARFEGDATFEGARFHGNVRFARVALAGRASFEGAAFAGQAWFGGARFEGPASFMKAEFANLAWFGRATFSTDAHFEGATFRGDTTFDGAAFDCHALFPEVTFLGEASLERARFRHNPDYRGAAFAGKGGAPQAAVRQAIWSGAALAPWSARARASLVDAAIPLAVVSIAAATGLFFQSVFQYQGAATAFAALGLVAAVVLVVRSLVEQGHTGQTRGKRRVGICLVRERDGEPVGPWRSIARQVLHVLDTLPAFAGWLRPMWDPKRQTFADTLVTSVVVKRRGWARTGATEAGAAPARDTKPGGG